MIFQFSLPLPVHSVTLRALSWKDIFAQSTAAFHVFQGRGSCSGNRRGGEPQPGQCWALLSVPGKSSGERREVSFGSPDESPAGFFSHYIVPLKCQAAHMNSLLWGYSSGRGGSINAFILMRNQVLWKDLF